MVEIEAAQEILVGLAVAAVLRDDEARHGLEQLAVRSTGRVSSCARVTVPWLDDSTLPMSLWRCGRDDDLVEIIGGYAGGE